MGSKGGGIPDRSSSTSRALLALVAIGLIWAGAAGVDKLMKGRPGLNPLLLMTPKDNSRLATQLAAKLKSDTGCGVYGAAILEAGKGPYGDGRAITVITRTFDEAQRAGCAAGDR